MAKQSLAENLKRLLGVYRSVDESFFDDLADSLVEGDLGAKLSFEIVEDLRKRCNAQRAEDHGTVMLELRALLDPFVKEISLTPSADSVSVYLLLGVNGVGKTTSAAKMARWYESRVASPVILAAADTFRAAAIEQLQLHGERLGVRVVAHQNGSDPGAVVFSAADAARASGGGLVIADTAGRLHNRENLVKELQKIDRIAASRASQGCYKKFLVLDATTGQNGIRQAEVFHSAVGVDAVILTKYDSTARGGIAISVGKDLGIPVAFVGTGETYDDFAPFDKTAYLSEFLGKP